MTHDGRLDGRVVRLEIRTRQTTFIVNRHSDRSLSRHKFHDQGELYAYNGLNELRLVLLQACQ